MKQPLIVTVTGPSSAGKTELSKDLSHHGFEPLVSTTTRLPRQGEVQDRDYHFISKEEFQWLRTNNGLIESVEYDQNHYGISSAEAERAFAMGKPAVLVAEPHGVAQIAEYCHQRGWEVFRIFVNNPPQVLVQRMLQRVHGDTKPLDIAIHTATAAAAAGDPEAQASIANNEALIAKRLTTHANRIGQVLGFEQVEWVGRAKAGKDVYELFVEEFNEINRQAVLQSVLERVNSFLAEPTQTPGQRRPRP